MLLEAHVFNTETPALKSLYLQESRLRGQYTRELRELKELQKERVEQEKRQKIKRLWEEEKQAIRECGCEDCTQLAQHFAPQPLQN